MTLFSSKALPAAGARVVASRRALLKALTGLLLAPAAELTARRAAAGPAGARARRLIVFYFPDGVPAPEGAASPWHPTGSEATFTLPDATSPLAPFRDSCVFFRGLSMGGTDSGSHPGGAKKLLTAVDGGGGESIDRYLARTVGADAPFRHVYLGAMASQNNASGDKYISYPSAGTTAPPEDDPRRAFERLFGAAAPRDGAASPPPGSGADAATASVIDTALADLDDLRRRLGETEKRKLDLHLEALRDVERRVKGLGPKPTGAASCDKPGEGAPKVAQDKLYDPATFPAILRAQTDTLVLAMACGLTRVGVLQASQHTSELIMSRFPGTALSKPGFDMRSHQASHYGQASDPKYADYVAQRRWFVEQLAYLLGALKSRPEGDGTMLDYSLVLACSEVGDGNTHVHDDMPFVLAGKGGGAIRAGRLLSFPYRRHADLLCGVARAMGDGIATFGQECRGPLPGLLA